MNMLDMMYRIYVRWPNQTTTDKTTTENGPLAELAFRALLARDDLRGTDAGAALTGDGTQIGYFDFATQLFKLHGHASELPASFNLK